jgi:dipeptidyl aminopeptidase/acylaminoacyl peptidase
MRTRRNSIPCLVATLFGVALIPAAAVGAEPGGKADPYSRMPELIPRGLLCGDAERLLPQVSPDGRWIAFLAPHRGALNVWVRSASGGDDRVVTRERRQGIRPPHLIQGPRKTFWWQYDSRHVLYAQDEGRDDNFHILQTDIETGATRDLTPFKGCQAQILGLSAAKPNELLVISNHVSRSEYDVFRVDLTTGEVTLETKNPGGAISWAADNALVVRAVWKQAGAATELLVRDGGDDVWREFKGWPAGEPEGRFAGFSADNRRLRIIAAGGHATERLLEADLRTGELETIAADERFDVRDVAIHPGTLEPQAACVIRERSEWNVLDQAFGEDLQRISRAARGDVYVLSRDQGDRLWTVAMIEDQSPVTYFLFRRDTGRVERLFSEHPALENVGFAAMRPVEFKARDGLVIPGYLSLPVGLEPKNLPMVVWVHAGPSFRDVWGFNPWIQWLTNRGYAVLQVNFRGSVGYGKAFRDAAHDEWGGPMQSDVIDGKNWAVAQGYADPKRVGVMGGSYGGYATLAAMTFTPGEFACGIAIVGPSVPRGLDPAAHTQQSIDARSPVLHAAHVRAPLMIVHGANDYSVPIAESDKMVEALKAHGKSVEYLVFPDEGHGIFRPENRLKFFAAAEEFLARHLGGRVEPTA